MAKKSRIRARAARPRHGARVGTRLARPHVARVAQEAATAALNEHIRDHKVDILAFATEAEIYLDGRCVQQQIPTAQLGRIETVLAQIGSGTRAFTVVVHDHTTLSHD